jgi:hypothetical protein
VTDIFGQSPRQNEAPPPRRAPSQRGPGSPDAPSRKRPRNKANGDDQFLEVGKLRTQYLDYLQSKDDEIEEQKVARHYYHSAQLTGEQLKVLRDRHQPAMVWNRVGRKINGIVGLVERSRSDPKAQPRSVKSEQGANIATQVIRYVLDDNDWKGVDPWCLLQACIDGIAGVQMVLSTGDEDDPDISLPWVIGDEFFYDPTSYRLDFSDARYMGISKWIDLDQAIEMFPDKQEMLEGLVEGSADLTSNPDREIKWVITSERRIRLIEHWYIYRGQWRWAFYVANQVLDEGLSPFYDERGKRRSSFIMFSVSVDHDGDRYGFVRNLKGPQDALNQSKSKALHIANSRRLIMDKGAVDDVETTRREWARPDGVVEKNPGLDIAPDQTQQDLAAQLKFSDDAKNEIDQYANLNVAAMSGSGINNISGRAVELLRQPGMAELGPFVMAVRQWKLAIYRLIWDSAQRYWTSERWLRVSDDPGVAKFIKLNGLGLDQYGRPALVNALGALDVDIILEEGPDVASVMQDTYDALKGYPPGTFPPQVIIEMSPLPRTDKTRILQMLQPKPPPPNPIAQAATKLQLEGAAAKNALTAAQAKKTEACVDQVMADAEAKRAKIGTEAAKAGHLAHQSHLDGAELVKDTFFEAHDLMAKFRLQEQQAQQAAQQPQGNPPQAA